MVHMSGWLSIVVCFGLLTADAVLLRASRNASRSPAASQVVYHEDVSIHVSKASTNGSKEAANESEGNRTRQPAALTFPSYVESVTTGRGIWKWSNALEAYERHLLFFKNKVLKLAEVGVWSGGSLLMWHAVLGPYAYVYGMDISKDALHFADPPKTTVYLLDQGDPAQWTHFFTYSTPKLDILIDDGGHTSPLMLTTTSSVWPHISDGGILAIEDIHGAHYLEDFFVPVAFYYGETGRASLAALHVYPFLLVAEKMSKERQPFLPVAGVSPATRVSTMDELLLAISTAFPGSHVILENSAWGDFLQGAIVATFFRWFNGLHSPTQMYDMPVGCALTNLPTCASHIVNSEQQAKIAGVHIYPDHLLIELAVVPPVIQAVRHGSEWVKYPTHS